MESSDKYQRDFERYWSRRPKIKIWTPEGFTKQTTTTFAAVSPDVTIVKFDSDVQNLVEGEPPKDFVPIPGVPYVSDFVAWRLGDYREHCWLDDTPEEFPSTDVKVKREPVEKSMTMDACGEDGFQNNDDNSKMGSNLGKIAGQVGGNGKAMCGGSSDKEIEMDVEAVSDEEEEEVMLSQIQENGRISDDSSDMTMTIISPVTQESNEKSNPLNPDTECVSEENGNCDSESEMEVDESSDIAVGKLLESEETQHSKVTDNSGENELEVVETVEHCPLSNPALSETCSESGKALEEEDGLATISKTREESTDALPGKECDDSGKLTEKETMGEKMDDKTVDKVDKRDEAKGNSNDNDSESDDDRPQIFLRNFAEITERDSDEDDEDVQEVFVSEKNSASALETEPAISSLKTYSKKDKAITRLSEISTFDDRLASLEMSAEDDSNIYQRAVNVRAAERKRVKGCSRLATWLKRQVSTPNKPDTRPSVPTVPVSAISRIGAAPESSRPTTRLSANSSRESNAAVLSSMLQSVQQTYPMPPMSASQLVYGRGASAPTRLPRQQVPPLSLISSSSTFVPGTTIIPMNGLWQAQSSQGIQRPNAPPVQMRNNTTVTSVTSVPRPSTTGGNVQSPFTQLIYDPATGYLLCPTSQSCQVVSQQSNPVQQQLVASPSNSIRIQNGMIIRPSDSSFNNTPRQVIGSRNGLEISLSNVSQAANAQQRMPLQQPRAPVNVVRSFAPVQHPRQQVSSRFNSPQQNAVNSSLMQHGVMASQLVQQQRARAPVPAPVPRATLPIRYPPIRPSSPQVKPPSRTPSPQSQRPAIIANAAQRVNGIPVPVSIPSKPGQGTSAAPADAGNVTAGNQKPIPGTVEEADSDLQNKTFPSLVVQVKTCLSAKPNRQSISKSRAELDAGVKAVLVHPPAKFTEWLMRRGLLKLAHYCELHENQSFKLGMYSDSSRQPFSGGYVWTSDCCPDRQISVFNGSIFEGSKYPPGTVLKLMYHWACQTPANNTLQWVKVSSLYLKNFFTLLRAVCISWMHEQCPPMGGESKYVEIGVITLGSSAETSRGVKNVNVEILGVFDPATKIIRMKVINSMQNQLFKDKTKPSAKPDPSEQGARAFQILWPLTHWVDKRSVLLVDGIIDRALFQELGFKNIQQCNEGQRSLASNTNVMNYLRNLVPKMFSSTLSVLSKSIVQQFLDELSWREMYGSSVLSSFDNLLDHIGTMTKWDLRGESLISRLNKINQNPFVDWSYTKQTRRCPLNTVPLSLRNEPGIRECVKYVMKDEKKQPPPPPVYNSSPPPATAPTASSYVTQQKSAQKRKNLDTNNIVANIAYYREVYDTSPKIHSLQSYYYGSVRADENLQTQPQRFPSNLKCPMCIRTFTSNIEVCRHIFTHISSVTYRGSENSVCRICLKELPMGVSMQQHIHVAHTMVGFNTACRICEEKFKTEQELVTHMWDLHQRRETPYRCFLCNYASSFHYYAVQHHQEKHASEVDAVCPFCLKTFSCATVAHLKQLINHLQAHAQLQRRVKKCPRCVLTFVNDVDLEVHLQEHRSQEPSAKWIPYLLPPNEANIKMAAPPPSRTPLHISMPAVTAATLPNSAPPQKKQKLNQYPAKKKQSTLNATLAVPIDTNEKFGGSRYRIIISTGASGMCAECGNDINKPNHFIGRLSCTKCRYTTACQAAMDLHHERNHKSGSKSVKPGIKTKNVKLLKELMICKCGFSSTHPHKLANHLVSCDKVTAYPKLPITPNPATVTTTAANELPNAQSTSSLPDTSLPMAQPPLSPNLALLGREPAVTFEDMLSLEESMANTLEALALPPLLSPSAPMPQSPLSFEPSGPSRAQSQPAQPGSTETSNSWDSDAWELPLSGLIAKCKQKQ